MNLNKLIFVLCCSVIIPNLVLAIGLTAPGYRYCGPGNKGGTPRNELDSLCQSHDYCYRATRRDRKGRCQCDKDFVSGAYALSRSGSTKKIRRHARKFGNIIRGVKKRCFRKKRSSRSRR